MQWNVERYDSNATFNWDSNLNPILSHLNLKAHETVLDLGCGHGRLTTTLAPNCASIVAVDSSQAMITAAKDLLAKQPSELQTRCSFHVADGQELDKASLGQFDVVFSNAALHWMKEDPRAVVKGVYQNLRNGGRFVAEAGGFGNCIGIRAELHRALTARGKSFRDPWYFPTAEEYRTLLESEGFDVRYCELVPRVTHLTGGLRGWLETFVADSFLIDCTVAERAEIMDEVERNLAVDMQTAAGTWQIIYVRLRFVAFA